MTARLLKDAEFERLPSDLSRSHDERAMNLEELDGFLAALLCGPAPVHPSDPLPDFWGGELADEEAFSSEQQLKEFPKTQARGSPNGCHT